MHLSTEDLASGLSLLLLIAVLAGLVVSISVWRARKHGSTTLALDVTRNASLLYVWLMAVGVVVSGVQILAGPGVFLSDSVNTDVQSQEEALASSACVDEPSMMLCGSQVGPIPFGIRLLIYVGTVLGLLASAAVAWAIHNAARRAGEREPFHPSVSRTFGAMALVVMAAAVLGDLLQQIGMTLAARSLDWDATATPIRFGLRIELWPFAVAVGLFALSAIFRYGAQVQSERELLKRETEGLV
ncbi:hypothetical protein FVO59_03180 [Microbacterium esteraromaticum]|uniref:DUF2975 domain-containing protein n=1 Tax=Microbacterium esteraromaticum TaxID=57043 RepID=A0A7D7WBN8_9MICO|nr:hypothetical protein [Microbacterium esteraromaticum]QMU96319.1 hypothetical protein FVO59_03180 [Microbacterium esteraromaticum]